jgi:DNA transformation protein and related proteins
MTTKTDRLFVNLGSSQVRRRLKGHGFGVRKVETTGKHRAVIIHTATGEHLHQLKSLFQDVIDQKVEEEER